MKKNLVYWGLCIILYILYFQILKIIWDKWVPWNMMSDIIGLFILIIVNVPLSVITTEQIFKIIKDGQEMDE